MARSTIGQSDEANKLGGEPSTGGRQLRRCGGGNRAGTATRAADGTGDRRLKAAPQALGLNIAAPLLNGTPLASGSACIARISALLSMQPRPSNWIARHHAGEQLELDLIDNVMENGVRPAPPEPNEQDLGCYHTHPLMAVTTPSGARITAQVCNRVGGANTLEQSTPSLGRQQVGTH